MFTQIGLWPSHPGLAHYRVITTDRQGGTSTGSYASLNLSLTVGDERHNVLRNRRRIANALGVLPENCTFCQQPQTGRVAQVKVDEFGRGFSEAGDAIADCDGLVAQLSDCGDQSRALWVLGADGLMFVMVDPQKGAGGVFHIGCQEALKGMPDRAVESLQEIGCDPRQLRASISPHACSSRYEVGEDIQKGCIDKYGRWAEQLFRQSAPRKYLFDLQALITARLETAGMPREHMQLSLECTISRTDLLFSECYAQKAGFSTGRQAMILVFDP